MNAKVWVGWICVCRNGYDYRALNRCSRRVPFVVTQLHASFSALWRSRFKLSCIHSTEGKSLLLWRLSVPLVMATFSGVLGVLFIYRLNKVKWSGRKCKWVEPNERVVKCKSNIIRRHIGNRKLLPICILLLSHSFIFFIFYFYQYIVVFLFNTVIYVFLLFGLCILFVQLPWLRVFRVFSSVVSQMQGYNSPRRGTARTVPKVLCCSVYCLFCVVLCTVCV
jgi:hypothetical protein